MSFIEMRLGELIRHFRLRAKRSLRETADALGTTQTVLAEVERGRRPLSWAQVESLCAYLDVPDHDEFHMALTQFHRQIWSRDDDPLVTLVEQIEQVASSPHGYDVVELVAALKSAISTMDIARGALERANRVICHLDRGSFPDEFSKDSEVIAQVSLLLGASLGVARWVLEHTSQKDDGGES